MFSLESQRDVSHRPGGVSGWLWKVPLRTSVCQVNIVAVATTTNPVPCLLLLTEDNNVVQFRRDLGEPYSTPRTLSWFWFCLSCPYSAAL